MLFNILNPYDSATCLGELPNLYLANDVTNNRLYDACISVICDIIYGDSRQSQSPGAQYAHRIRVCQCNDSLQRTQVGRDPNEDDRRFAFRCMQQAHRLLQR